MSGDKGHDPGVAGCFGALLAVIIIIVLEMLLLQAIEKRDNWILDLQRRVAELEQKK